MASLQAEQQERAGEPSSSVDGREKQISDTEHAQKSDVETASSNDICKKQSDTVDHPLVCSLSANFCKKLKFLHYDAISMYSDSSLDIWFKFYSTSAQYIGCISEGQLVQA